MSASAFMGAPTSVTGLLGAAQTGYPLTSGLLGAIGNAGGVGPYAQALSGAPNWTQVALQLAGNPHAGPYATNLGTVPGGTPVSSGNYSPSTSSQVAGGLLGALGKVPGSTLSNAINGLMYGNLGSQAAADGNAADSLVNSQLGNVANDGTAASVANSNAAALNAMPAATQGAGSAAPAAGSLINDLGSADAASALANAGNYTGAADAAIGSQLGSVADDGTAASVAAANDAALNATDGGAAGAAAGTSGNASGALGDAGTVLGALGSAYSLYNTANNWQSGNTGSDALNGAETGASIGTMVVPGIGTVIGGLIGAAAGAASSAFGGGRKDPETQTWNSVAGAYNQNSNALSGSSPAQLYQNLAGVMDAKNNTPGHSQPIEQVFGREGEGNLMDQLGNYINQQYQAGKITPGESISNQWSQIINPWLQSKKAGIANQNTSSGQPEGPALTSDLQGLIQAWENGLFNSSTQMGIAGQPISGLPAYLG